MNNSVAIYDPKVSLLEVRADSKTYPRIKDIPFSEAVEKVKAIILTAYIMKGQKPEGEDIERMAAILVSELVERNDYGTMYITLHEIHYAIRKGLLDPSQEVYGISVVSLFKLIAHFAKTEGRANQDAVMARRRTAVPKEIGEAIDKASKIMIENIKRNRK